MKSPRIVENFPRIVEKWGIFVCFYVIEVVSL